MPPRTLTLPPSVVPVAPPQTLRVACYSRYSSHLQDDGWSIEAQHHAHDHEAATRGAAGMGCELIWYDEPAESGHVETIERRPVFARLLRDAQAGAFDMVWVHKMDRFSRRLSVTTEALQRLNTAGVGFLSLAERFDLTTPAGWLTANLFAALADFYSRNLGAEIMKGKRARASSGLHGCRVPYGYRRPLGATNKTSAEFDVSDGRTDELGRELGDWTGLHYLYGLLLEGMTDQEAATAMNRDGRWRLSNPSRAKDDVTGQTATARLFTRASVSAIRRSRYYRPFQPGDTNGTVVGSDGTEYRGQHVAACTWDEWTTMQEIASGRRRGWYRVAGTPYRSEQDGAEFRALASCSACGGRLYVWRTTHRPKAGGDPTIYERYVCTAADRQVACVQDRHYARVEDVRAAWVAWLDQHLRLPDQWEASVRANIVKRATPAQDGGAMDEAQREAQIRHWKVLRDRAIELYAENLQTKEWRNARLKECDRELAHLHARGQDVQRQQASVVEAGHMVVHLARMWPLMHHDERVKMAALLIEPGGLVLDLLCRGRVYSRAYPPRRDQTIPTSGRIVSVRLRAPFQALLDILAPTP